MEIEDKIFGISGASSGLGHATAAYLLEKGAYIIALDIRKPDDSVEYPNQDRLRYFSCDVLSQDEVKKHMEKGIEEFGALHGCIACAGIAPAAKLHSSRNGSHSAEDFLRTLEINLAGTFHLFNASVPFMKDNPSDNSDGEKGVLIATSSVAAYEGQIGQAAYAASKGGVAAMILPLARELSHSGIRVNAIAPGIFQTPMVEAFPKEVRESLAASVPFPARLGRPEEYAHLAVHIIENPYINGTVIRLDGGVRMR